MIPNTELPISRTKILEKNENVPWANKMVLNPAIIEKDGILHMLFRATGDFGMVKTGEKPLPYPICLGYGRSADGGNHWEFDWERPALTPKNEELPEKIYLQNNKNETVVNYSNGCIEDPRLFTVEGKCYMTAACRMFPPGPYWEHDDPVQCCPEWIAGDHPFGDAARKNVTVSVLYEVDLDALNAGDYDNAFFYVTNLTDPAYGENRDVILFPEKMKINGKLQYVMLERPVTPNRNPLFRETSPSIVITAAESLYDLHKNTACKKMFATPRYLWEKDRIGASAPLLKTDDTHWLLSYHGKQDDEVGYTQSFMILENRDNDFPEIIYRSDERLLTVSEEWEKPNHFKTPCIFITGMIRQNDELLLSYGAADECVGIMRIPYRELLNRLK